MAGPVAALRVFGEEFVTFAGPRVLLDPFGRATRHVLAPAGRLRQPGSIGAKYCRARIIASRRAVIFDAALLLPFVVGNNVFSSGRVV